MSRTVGFVLLAAATACGGGLRGTAATSTVRDSAGILVVESRAPAWTDSTAWRVEEPPLVDLGVADADGATSFFNIRGVHRMADGSIAVMDGGSYSLKFFGTDGRLIGKVGHQGQGPGEFPRQIEASYSCGGDTVYVRVFGGRYWGQMMRFAAPGTYAGDLELSYDGRPALAMGCSGGRWVAGVGGGRPVKSGRQRVSASVGFFDLAGRQGAVVAELPGGDGLWKQFGTDYESGWGYMQAPFGRTTSIALGADGFAAGNGDSFEITYYDTTGNVRRIARVSGFERPLTSRDIDRYREFVVPGMQGNQGEAEELERALQRSALPRTLPVFAALRFDPGGSLWVRQYDFIDAVGFFDNKGGKGRRARESSRRWFVLDSVGAFLGEVRLPPRFEVHEIGADWILGIWRDEVDVEHVRLYRIHKSS